jgi:hypothetical protein
MGATVQTGLYWGFTQAEITAEIARYKNAVKTASAHMEASGGGRVTSGSIGAQNVTFSYPFGINSLEQWGIELQNAQAALDDLDQPYVTQAILGAGSLS